MGQCHCNKNETISIKKEIVHDEVVEAYDQEEIIPQQSQQNLLSQGANRQINETFEKEFSDKDEEIDIIVTNKDCILPIPSSQVKSQANKLQKLQKTSIIKQIGGSVQDINGNTTILYNLNNCDQIMPLLSFHSQRDSQVINQEREEQLIEITPCSLNELTLKDNYPETSQHWMPSQYNNSILIFIHSCHQIQNNLEIGLYVPQCEENKNKQAVAYQMSNILRNLIDGPDNSFCKLSKLIYGNSAKDIIFKQSNKKQNLLQQINQLFKIQKEGTVLYFVGNSDQKSGSLIFYDDQELKQELFQVSFEEIVQFWNNRVKKQKVLLLLLDSQYTWHWIPKIKANNDLSIFIQTIKGLNSQILTEPFIPGQFSENIFKVLTNSKQKLNYNQYYNPIFFGYNDPYQAYQVIGLPIFFFCFSQMVHQKDKINVINYQQDDNTDPNKSEIQYNLVSDIKKYMGFVNQDGTIRQFGSALYKNDDFYIGEWQKEQKCGLGILQFQNGYRKVYFGRFKQDQFQGEGLLINNDGSYYLGSFDNGKYCGTGAMFYSNGEQYHGDFLNDKRHGQGEERQVNGKTFKGQYMNDQKEGHGVIKNADGYLIYEGDFENNIKSGHGKEIYDDEGKIYYEGDWAQNQKNGSGKEYYGNGAYFEGQFVDDLKEDIGKYVYSNGSVFEGKFHEDMMNGKGVYNDINGLRYEGLWLNNLEEGQFMVYKNDELHEKLFYLRGVPKKMLKNQKTIRNQNDLQNDLNGVCSSHQASSRPLSRPG